VVTGEEAIPMTVEPILVALPLSLLALVAVALVVPARDRTASSS